MKYIFTQERPDRRSAEAHLQGAPFSRRPLQSFPSGHVLHIDAVASAASELPGQQRAFAWTAGSILALTRIFLLAHWTSDVAAGLALGVALERVIRHFTGYSHRRCMMGSALTPPGPNAVHLCVDMQNRWDCAPVR
jgi:hypothetical protein